MASRGTAKVPSFEEADADRELGSPGGVRFNLRAGAVLLGLLVLIPAIWFPLTAYQNRQLRRAALAQAAQAVEAGNLELAVSTLNHGLETWPEDVEIMEKLAKLLTEKASAPDEILEAARMQDLLLRLDPEGKDRQENRRHLVELYLRHGDFMRLASERRELLVDKFESRYRSAVKIAQQRITFGADDAVSHRLLAMAQESLATIGDDKAMAEATFEFERALRLDPGDAISGEHLAMILFKKRQDLGGADEIIQELIQARPGSAEVRLSAYRHFMKTGREDRARTELKTATALAPTDLDVLLTATGDAVQRNDPADARRLVNSIPAAARDDRRVMLLRGHIELVQEHPETAIEIWKQGLARSRGTDRDLTWQLARLCIRLHRFPEARVLVDQYDRLSWDRANPMTRLLRGLLYQQTGATSRAIADLEAAKPSISESWSLELELALGQCYELFNDNAKAVGAFRRALDSAPYSVVARRSLARLMKKTEPAKAAELIEAGITKASSDPGLLTDLVAIRLEQQLAKPQAERDWSVVERTLKRAEQEFPGDLNLLKLRADALAGSSRSLEALALLEKATSGPAATHEEFWIAWANGLISLNRVDEAIAILDRASATSAVGDRASIRTLKARLLVRTGHARAARDLLTKDLEKLPVDQKATLARVNSEVLLALRDPQGAIAACLEWAKLAPDDPQPGLTLMAIAQEGGGEEAAKLGLERLKAVGGEDEPYALAARAFDLLFSGRARDETRSMRYEMADKLSGKLQAIAPQLPISFLVRAIVLEQGHRIEEAVSDYRIALRGNTASMALPRLVDLLTRLKRYEDLAVLRQTVGDPAGIDRLTANLSMKQGDKAWAEKAITNLVNAQPDNLEMRMALVRLLQDMGRPKQGETALLDLVERQPGRADAWQALVSYQTTLGNAAEVAQTIERLRSTYTGERPELLTARCLWISGEIKQAGQLYDEAVARNPSDPTTLRVATDFAVATGRTARAEVILRQALRLRPMEPWAARQLALILSSRPDASAWPEAWSLVAPDPARPADAPDDRLFRATILERCPNVVRRAQAVNDLLALADDLPADHPAALEARGRLARAFLDANKPAEAARLLAPATEDTVSNSGSLLALAVEAFSRANRVEDAARRLARLASLERESARVTCARAWVFLARGKKDDATVTLERGAELAIEAADGEAACLSYLDLLLKFGQVEPAERVAQKIAKKWPARAALLGKILGGLGRMDPAIDACQTAAQAGSARDGLEVAVGLVVGGKLDPAQGERVRALVDATLAKKSQEIGLLNLSALLAHFQGRYEDEVRIDEKVLELDPANAFCLNNMAWTLCQCLDRPDEALKKSEEAIRVVGRIPMTSDTRGVILTRLNRLDEAVSDLELATKGDPTPNRYFHLARAYQKAGKANLHQTNRDLATKLGVKPASLDPLDRADYAGVMGQ